MIETVPRQIPEGESGTPIREIKGHVSGSLDSSHVVIYSYTNEWFVQPFEESSSTPIDRDGAWSALIHGGSYYLALLVQDDFRALSPSQAPPYALPGVTSWAVVAGVRPWYDKLLDVVVKLRWFWGALTGISLAFLALLFRKRKSMKEVSV
ncbi:MAG TPA: hypothetical protein VEU96_15480 [Bryobacteraceae bacterium]|nr:hypothetical protein [Bryobacteraceae bacterium]